jgi:hypothetical protein
MLPGATVSINTDGVNQYDLLLYLWRMSSGLVVVANVSSSGTLTVWSVSNVSV